tara:strand:- start:453 stop:1412 length:960 start_codon:yes stop_codon:yes gene_type:complete
MLYPIKKSFATHLIDVGKHTLYLEEYGKPDGVPIIFLHGGPGSGCNDSQKKIFNNKKMRVIFLDQRGAGKSKPKLSLEENNTSFLVKDINTIREHLKIKKWFIVGGSWGATLALAYALENPEHVRGIILRALFLGTEQEVEWAFHKAPLAFKPSMIDDINKILGNRPYQNPIKKLGEMLDSKNKKKNCIARELWGEYEKNLSTITAKDHDFNKIINNTEFCDERYLKAPNTPLIEWHYIKNKFFMKNNHLFKNKNKLSKIPIKIIQGQFDLLCPPVNSYNFAKSLNKAEIITIPSAGHYSNDPGIAEKMKKIIDELVLG